MRAGCFALLLPMAELRIAIRLIERLREGFSQLQFFSGAAQCRLTPGVGVVQISEKGELPSPCSTAERPSMPRSAAEVAEPLTATASVCHRHVDARDDRVLVLEPATPLPLPHLRLGDNLLQDVAGHDVVVA